MPLTKIKESLGNRKQDNTGIAHCDAIVNQPSTGGLIILYSTWQYPIMKIILSVVVVEGELIFNRKKEISDQVSSKCSKEIPKCSRIPPFIESVQMYNQIIVLQLKRLKQASNKA